MCDIYFVFLNLRREKKWCRGGREEGLFCNQQKTKLSQTQRFLLLITKFMDDEYANCFYLLAEAL